MVVDVSDVCTQIFSLFVHDGIQVDQTHVGVSLMLAGCQSAMLSEMSAELSSRLLQDQEQS